MLCCIIPKTKKRKNKKKSYLNYRICSKYLNTRVEIDNSHNTVPIPAYIRTIYNKRFCLTAVLYRYSFIYIINRIIFLFKYDYKGDTGTVYMSFRQSIYMYNYTVFVRTTFERTRNHKYSNRRVHIIRI